MRKNEVIRSRTGKTVVPSRTSRRRPLRRAVAISVAGLLIAMTGFAVAVTPASADGSAYDPSADMNSMYNTTAYSGAAAWWNAGYTGAGVDVALIDTGVSPVAGLD